MLRNVFQQLGTEALKVSRNQTVSTIVESLVSEATPAQLVLILNAFAQDWNTACTDRYTRTQLNFYLTPRRKKLSLALLQTAQGDVIVARTGWFWRIQVE